MKKLSDTQLVVLSTAAQRADLSILPLAESLKLKGGALAKVMDSLRNRGLIRVVGSHGGPQRVVITSEGMAAIGVEADDDAPTGGSEADTGTTTAESDAPTIEAPAPTAQPGEVAPATGEGEGPPRGASAAKPTPRAGTKQALMIEMLKHPAGATVDQIAAATGWQRHTVRGAISGALKKKLGLVVEATREVGLNATGAKGSATVYRITGWRGAAIGTARRGKPLAATSMPGPFSRQTRPFPALHPGPRGNPPPIDARQHLREPLAPSRELLPRASDHPRSRRR